MRKLSSLLIALLCVQVATPSGAAAQQKDEDAKDFMKDVLGNLLGNHWNMFLTSGVSTTGRFLLQRPDAALNGEQALESKTGYNIGIGGGGDYFLRQGYRLYYNYAHNNLKLRTNNGDGSSALDIDPDAGLSSNTVGLELIRYMLPARAAITPYGTLGLSGTWWGLNTSSPLVVGAGGNTQFSMGASLAFGVQVREWEQFGFRVEGAKLTTGNPFTGKRSFKTTGAIPFDEPTHVGKWDYRVAGVYYFKKKSDVMPDRTISKQPQ